MPRASSPNTVARPVPSMPLAVAMVAALVAAGCVAPATNDAATPDPLAGFTDPMLTGDGHDHADRTQHELTWNMEEVGWTNMVDKLSVAWGEMDLADRLGVVAWAHPTAGFATLDTSNPSKPTVLDTYDTGIGYGADIKLARDATIAVLAVQEHGDPDPMTIIAAQDTQAAAVSGGLQLYDIRDPSDIRFLSATPFMQTGGVHMVFVHTIADTEYIFAAHNAGGVGIYELRNVAGTPQAVLVRTIDNFASSPDGDPQDNVLRSAHDMTVYDDEPLGVPVLWIADSFLGIAAFDVSDPLEPAYLGGWQDPDNTWYTHTVRVEVLDDGSRRAVVVPEVYSDAEALVVSPLWVLDATELGDIRLLATWNAPGDHGADQLRFSVHNLALVNGTIALAHYHGGVWILDVVNDDDDGNATVVPVGYHVPHHDPGWAMSGIYHGTYNMGDAPTVWDVAVHDGVVWATDVNSGVYAMQHDAFGPGDQSHG